MSEMTAFDWLTAIADDPTLSAPAKELSAIMSGGWTGVGRRCRRGSNWVLEHSRIPDHATLRAASGELREAGFITGQGVTASVWRLHDPAVQRPLVEARRRAEAEKKAARALEQKLRIVMNGGAV